MITKSTSGNTQRGNEIDMELEAGSADRFQGDLWQLLDAKKLQKFGEEKGVDSVNNNGDNSLVVQ